MITPEYCRMMARYNAWQNRQVTDSVENMPLEELTKDRGAFFGSILATLNHLLWADTLWIARFDGGKGPDAETIPGGTTMTQNANEWALARFRLDGRISSWAKTVTNTDLSGDLKWHSTAMNKDFSKPIALCVMQVFNHQTHHRGQVHAMLGAAGAQMPVTDIPFMPE